MRILYDHQIFVAQRFGGISRYFNELKKLNREGVQVIDINPDLFIDTSPEPGYDLFSRGVRFLKRKIGFERKIVKKFPKEAEDIFNNDGFDIKKLEDAAFASSSLCAK